MNVVEQNKVTIWQMFRAIEHWAARNDVGMARQLGLLPEAATSTAK